MDDTQVTLGIRAHNSYAHVLITIIIQICVDLTIS